MADRLQVFFLESFWQLAAVVVAGAVLCFRVWHQRRTKGSFRLMIGWPAVGIVMLILQAAVTTDRERVRRAIGSMARAVDDGHVEALGAFISESLAGPWSDKDDFMEDATRWLERNSIDAIGLDSVVVVVNDDTATGRFRARARVQTEATVWPMTFSLWELQFRREADSQWRVVRIRWKQPGNESFRELLPYLR